jgi:hypothetical protein
VATASTGEARLVATSKGEQTEEGASRAPVADVAWPGVATTSQVKVAQLEPPSAQAVTSVAGWIDGGTSRAPMAGVAWLGVVMVS